jgi:hypothetical protein
MIQSSRLFSSKQEIVKIFVQDVFPEAWNSIGSNELVMADNNNQGLLSTFLPLCHHQFIH